MIRRLPLDAPVRKPDGDNELLRIVASAANEAIEALALPAPKSATALNEVVVRYARTLRLTTRVLDGALHEARESLHADGAPRASRHLDSVADDLGEAATEAARIETAAALQREQHG